MNDKLLDRSANELGLARAIRISKRGKEFDLAQDRWQLTARESLETVKVKAKFTEALMGSMLLTLADYAEQNAAETARNVRNALMLFAEYASPKKRLECITKADLMGFRHHTRERLGHDGATATLRGFLRRCWELGYEAVSQDTVDEMGSWVLKNAPVGEAVNREDVGEGPLTREELAGLEAEWMSHFESGSLGHEELTCVLLLSRTGRRPAQVASLKLKDLDDSRFDDAKSGDTNPPRRLLLVHFPRAKQRSAGWRELFRSVELIPATWNLCVVQQRLVVARIDDLLTDVGLRLQPLDLQFVRDNTPLFPMWSAIHESRKELHNLMLSGQHGAALQRLVNDVTSDAWHPDKHGIARILDKACADLEASNRIGEPLRASARRFRYYLATEMDRMGVGQGIIAHALDHNDTSTILAYRQNHPGRARVINKATARSLTPLVRIFRGEVVDSEADAIGGDDPAATRILFRGAPAATCGDRLQCGFDLLPIPCYTCDHFQPWLNGPHEDVLEVLLDERRQRQEVLGFTSPLVERDDKTVFAVVQVIQRCEVRRAELARTSGTSKASNGGPRT